MASLISGFEYDVFISYRQKDNKHDGWVSEFVDNLKGELESTCKEEINLYFDINPHDGLLETYDVNASLKDKLKCLVFIPIISRTYCDSNAFAWEHEFKAFIGLASCDQFGLKIKLPNGNVANRMIPVQIHDLYPEDKALIEKELGGVLRSIEFIYKEPGVNRPLTAKDNEEKNLNKTNYRNQVNKVANAIDEVIHNLKKVHQPSAGGELPYFQTPTDMEKGVRGINLPETKMIYKKSKRLLAIGLSLFLCLLGAIVIFKIVESRKKGSKNLVHEKSIAVLPFVNLSNDPEQEYFSDGMVEAILDDLCKVGGLKVISSTSTRRYKRTDKPLKEISHELGVSAILEGSVQKIGNNVRITAQLIDTKTDIHLWSDKYDKELSDVFSIYSEVAQNVAKALKITLTPEETDMKRNSTYTSSTKAYDYYLKGNYHKSKYESIPAIEMYSKSIQEDPSFTAAYAKRAIVHLYLWWIRGEGYQIHELKAQEDIKNGLILNSKLPELMVAQATYVYQVNRDYESALKILDQLRFKNPNMADIYAYTAYILRRKGDMETAVSELKKGIQLDPYNAGYLSELVDMYRLLHQYDESIKYTKLGMSVAPDYRDFHSQLFKAYLNKTGDLDLTFRESGFREKDFEYEAYYYTRQYDQLLRFIKNDTSIITQGQFFYLPKTFRLASIYYLSGEKTKCEVYSDSTVADIIEKIKANPLDERYFATLGKCYAFTGKYIEAVACGRKAVDLKPVKLDAWQGAVKEQDLMEIYIWTGNYDLALDKMEYLLSIPSNLSVGELLINPIYDKLRDTEHFQRIIAAARKRYQMK